MQTLTILVKNKTKGLILEEFSVVFDGWSGEDTHYVDAFHRFSATYCFPFSRKVLKLSANTFKDTLNAAECSNM